MERLLPLRHTYEVAAHLSLKEQLRLSPTNAVGHFTSAEALIAIMEDAGSLNPQVKVTQTQENAWLVVVERTFEAEWPGWLKGFVGDGLRIHEERTWTLESESLVRGTMSLRVHGQPVSMDAVVELRSEASGSLITVEADVRASVPLLGGKIETEVRTYLAEGIQHEIREFNKLA